MELVGGAREAEHDGVLSTHQEMRITHLRLQNWRNFFRVDVDLQDRNFLVGPNASGKSNFLDALRFLRDLVGVGGVGGGFASAVEDRGGLTRIRCLAARQPSHVVLEATVADDDEGTWTYELSITREERGQHRALIRSERVEHDGRNIFARPNDDDRRDPELLRQTHLEQVSKNLEFRRVAEFFASIHYFHVVPQLIRESDRWDSRKGDPFGGDLIQQILQTPGRAQRARLDRIERALAVAIPQLRQLQVERDPMTGVAHLKGKYLHWRPQGAYQSESDFSDGTLRLIGLLWALQDGDGPLLLEEPELSLHPAVVAQLPQLIARVQGRGKRTRQVFITTHSPDMIRSPGIAPDEVLLLTPSENGTRMDPGVAREDVRNLLEAGLPMDEVILPITRPPEADQLSRFAS
jgi:predicted ATPase